MAAGRFEHPCTASAQLHTMHTRESEATSRRPHTLRSMLAKVVSSGTTWNKLDSMVPGCRPVAAPEGGGGA